MNTLKTILTSLGLLFSLILSAQKSDTPTDLPYSNKIEVSNKALESLFLAPEIISLDLAPGFRLEGKIKNRSDHGGYVTSLLIKVESRPGGMLSISRYTDPKGNISYAGQALLYTSVKYPAYRSRFFLLICAALNEGSAAITACRSISFLLNGFLGSIPKQICSKNTLKP